MTTSAAHSLWLEQAASDTYPPPTADLDVDVVVLGGGIAGLTTALLLKRDGARVAVLEARSVGSGVTGCTTAKVTALQQTVLSTVRRRHGEDGAADYAQAGAAAVELLAAIVADEGIACDLERRPAFTYAASEKERSAVEGEYEAAHEAGLPVQLVEDADLPYPVHGAVRLDDQLQLHPVRYARGLAAAVHGDGCVVHEQTRALAVDAGSPCRVRTSARFEVSARQVVDATHYPMLDRGLFFARLEPTRSYCVAARVRGAVPEGMSISAGSNSRSLRSHDGLLIVGGEGHSTGARKATPARFEKLEEFAGEHWDVEAVTHRWSAQDPSPWDHLPVIGPYPASSMVFVASGFQKWGFTSATFAARILSDLIAGRESPWASRFSPSRIGVRGLPKLAQANAKVGADFVGDRLLPPRPGSADELEPGEARVMRDGLGKKGVFRDEAGTLHAVSLRCTHLGCLLRFNEAEHSWDCPCHGSRFAPDGAVLEGPATKPLERREVE